MRITWHPEAAKHMWERHRVTVAEATEALADPLRLIEHPDHASRSGRADRVIGYSPTRMRILCVIVLPHLGWGVNAWPANTRYIRAYEDGELR